MTITHFNSSDPGIHAGHSGRETKAGGWQCFTCMGKKGGEAVRKKRQQQEQEQLAAAQEITVSFTPHREIGLGKGTLVLEVFDFDPLNCTDGAMTFLRALKLLLDAYQNGKRPRYHGRANSIGNITLSPGDAAIRWDS